MKPESKQEDIQLTQEEKDAIIYDARTGDLETLKLIFEEIPAKCLLDIADELTKSTTIHMAAANGHTEVVCYLLSILSKEDSKKLVSMPNDSGNTPLHWAALNGHIECVKLLIEEFGADSLAKNKSGHDVMYEAENNNQDEVEAWLLNKFSPEGVFDVKEEGEETKITYKPGTESLELDKEDKAAKEKLQKEINTVQNDIDNLEV